LSFELNVERGLNEFLNTLR